MARKQNAAGNLPFQIDVGPEAVAFATDHLKSKIERDLVSNPISTVHTGLLNYRFFKERNGGEKVVYPDRFKSKPKPKPKPKHAAPEPEEAEPEIIEPTVPEDAVGIQKKKKPPLPAFMAGCMLNADGYPYQNTYNVLWALTRAKGLKGAFAFDEMTRSITVKFGDRDARQIADTDGARALADPRAAGRPSCKLTT